jgi:uncharacterized tellurite resistance protein B-like protein
MRTYPHNSPHAAARIVALTLLADGHLCKAEIDALDRLQAHDTLGLDKAELHGVLHTLCEDMLVSTDHRWPDACRIEPATLLQLMAEIDDPVLQAQVMRLCIAVANANHQVTEGEAIVLSAALDQWTHGNGPLTVHATS